MRFSCNAPPRFAKIGAGVDAAGLPGAL